MKERLWTLPFILLAVTNGFLFAGFHALLPTLPIYVESLGATGSEIGLITGIFGFSAILIRLFTDDFVSFFGKKKCLYLGLLFSILATMGYFFFHSMAGLLASRVLHGFGFGLTTTFAASIVVEVIPASRCGEGIGYFGLGSTVTMALAPAGSLALISAYGPAALFFTSAAFSALAIVTTALSGYHESREEEEEDRELAKRKSRQSLLSRIYEKGTGASSLLTILFGASYGSVNTFIAMMAKEAGIESAGLFFITGTVFIFISRPFGGRLLDRFGAFAVLLPGAILYSIGLVILLFSTSLPMLLLVSVFYGLGGGLLLPALMTWMMNSVKADRRSAASATFYNMLDIGTSAGILILGSIAGMVGYVHMYDYVLGAMVVFLVLLVVTRKRDKRARQ